MAVQYEPGVIVAFAEGLYKQAKKVVINYTVSGATPGILMLFASLYIESHRGYFLIPGIFITLAGIVIGYSLGQQRAFGLKLQAQTALCQVRIEENTRP